MYDDVGYLQRCPFESTRRRSPKSPGQHEPVEGSEEGSRDDSWCHVGADFSTLLTLFDHFGDEIEVLVEPRRCELAEKTIRLSKGDAENLCQLPLTANDPELGFDDVPEPTRSVRELRQISPQLIVEQLDVLFEQGNEEIIFVFEVEVDRPVGDARCACDLSDLCFVESLAREHLDRRFKNASSLVALTSSIRSAPE